jgi:dihydrofolate synthase/folylpolyglutamate synthase
VRAAAGNLEAPPTFFETTTAIAAEAFRRAGVDAAVFEVGLGGRLDATNVLSPVGVAITAVDFDHQEHLGHTLDAIAREKAGIIKAGRFCVLGPNRAEVRQVVEETCRNTHAELVMADQDIGVETRLVDGATRLRLRTPRTDFGELTLGLKGRHQVDNAITAARVLEKLAETELGPIPAAAIRTALEEVEWPARLELRQWNRAGILIDGAHNPAGTRALAAYLAEAYGRRLPIVFGAMRDKNLDEMIGALAPHASAFFCTTPASARAASPRELASIARRLAPSLSVTESASPLDAVTAAMLIDTPVVVAGSLYLAGEVRAKLS